MEKIQLRLGNRAMVQLEYIKKARKKCESKYSQKLPHATWFHMRASRFAGLCVISAGILPKPGVDPEVLSKGHFHITVQVPRQRR